MSKIITVVHVETGKHLYGGALQVLYIMRGLQALNVRNILVAPQGSAIAEAAQGIVDKVYEVPMRGDLDIPFIFRLKHILKIEQADIVHLHSRRGADTLGGIAAKLAKIPAVLSRRVDNPEPRCLVKLKYALYNHVITISNGIRHVLINEGLAPEKISCVYSSVDIEKYAQIANQDWFSKEFSLPKQAKVIAIVAQLIPRKGHHYLLEILPDLLSKHPDLFVLFFGKGPLQEQLQTQLENKAFSQRVKLAGFRSDLEKVFPCLYALVHPAEMEGLGVSLLQAAAASIPIIASNTGGIPEIVHHQKNGLLIEVGDTAALANSLNTLLLDENLATQMGQKGKHIVEEYFSIDAMVKGNLAIYQQMLKLNKPQKS